MGDIIDFRKSKRAGKPIAKICTHLHTKFDRLNRQLICAQCGEVIDANAWLYRHFEQLSKRHDEIEMREKRLNERAAEMIVQERKLQKLRTTEPCIHCGRTQTLPAPKVKADEKLAEIKAMLSKGKGA